MIVLSRFRQGLWTTGVPTKSYAWCRRSRFSFNVERQLQVADLGESMDRKRCKFASDFGEPTDCTEPLAALLPNICCF